MKYMLFKFSIYLVQNFKLVNIAGLICDFFKLLLHSILFIRNQYQERFLQGYVIS